MKRFKSMTRALKRVSLRWNSFEVPGEWYSDTITGIMTQRMVQVPFLERRTSDGRWIKY
jgi:hypothetical protein